MWTKDDAERLMARTWDEPRMEAPTIILKKERPAFRSPVDGSVIASDRALREHNARNNVVDSREFDDAHYAQAAKRRADVFNGVDRERKREIARIIEKLESET